MTHVIIDGYNLIRQIPELQRHEKVSLESARQHLISVLQIYTRVKKHRISVVFDGVGGLGEFATPYHEAGVEVIFSRAGEDADTVLKRLLTAEGARAILVSSDRELVLWAERSGSGHLYSPAFYQRLIAAMAGGMDTFIKDDDAKPIKQHKRWQTYKKGPSKKPSKRVRRNARRTDGV